jgi:ribosomal protein S26
MEAVKVEMARLESERIRMAKMKDDSLLAAKNKAAFLEAERIRSAKLKSDSLLAIKALAARIEADRIKAEKRRADSIAIAQIAALKSVDKDVVIYRIQFQSSVKPQVIKEINVNGMLYAVYEYFYLREYRYTIGEFKTLGPAKELQTTCRKNGYPQAFVVAFKNNKRSLDLDLFK